MHSPLSLSFDSLALFDHSPFFAHSIPPDFLNHTKNWLLTASITGFSSRSPAIPSSLFSTLSGTPNSKTDESPSATGCLRKSTTDEVPHRETPDESPDARQDIGA